MKNKATIEYDIKQLSDAIDRYIKVIVDPNESTERAQAALVRIREYVLMRDTLQGVLEDR